MSLVRLSYHVKKCVLYMIAIPSLVHSIILLPERKLPLQRMFFQNIDGRGKVQSDIPV